MIEKDISSFPEQLKFEPVITNGGKLKPLSSFIVCGMGGSHLSADLIKVYDPSLNLYVHHDYGIPDLPEDVLDKTLFIASSYSGNTEEVLDFVQSAQNRKLNLFIIAGGGKLLQLAKDEKVPYIAIPQSHLEPRMTIGYSMLSMLKAMGRDEDVEKLHSLSNNIRPESMKNAGREVWKSLLNKIPVIYSSLRNSGLAYILKIKLNETDKMPAFINTFPELNHNEIEGFGENNAPFTFLFIRDSSDHERVIKRTDKTKELYESKGFPVTVIDLHGETALEKIFNFLILSDWVSLYLAKEKGIDPVSVPMIEEFKKKICI